jgi:hypothetical protein
LKKCEICGKTEGKIINSKKFKKKLCNKHYEQLYTKGKIINRTIYDDNEIILNEYFAKLAIYDINCNFVGFSIIDLDDVDKVKEYKWGLSSKGYVITYIGDSCLLLHRLIMNCSNKMTVDHINHNTLDNRKINLRICSHSQNHMNKDIYITNKSGYKGVCWNNKENKWRAYISINKKQINLGMYVNIEDAKKARKEAEEKYFGEFAYRNQGGINAYLTS